MNEKINYKPPFLFSNPHLQTIYPVFFRKSPQINYQRERIFIPDGDFLDLDWLAYGNNELVLICHGMEGNSDAVYVRTMAYHLNKQNYDVVVLNLRGCSGTPNRLLRAYHSGETGDLAHTIDHIEKNYEYNKISLVGFSLGGNIVLKYSGEKGNQLKGKIKSVSAVSVPLDLKSCAMKMNKGFNKVYLKRFLKSFYYKLMLKETQFPGKLNKKAIRKMRSFYDLDSYYTAPVHGFSSAEEYWQKNSSKNFLSFIQIPTLIINAIDDPFLSKQCYPNNAKNQYNDLVHFLYPRYGGHIGFVCFNKSNMYWHERKICNFLNML